MYSKMFLRDTVQAGRSSRNADRPVRGCCASWTSVVVLPLPAAPSRTMRRLCESPVDVLKREDFGSLGTFVVEVHGVQADERIPLCRCGPIGRDIGGSGLRLRYQVGGLRLQMDVGCRWLAQRPALAGIIKVVMTSSREMMWTSMPCLFSESPPSTPFCLLFPTFSGVTKSRLARSGKFFFAVRRRRKSS